MDLSSQNTRGMVCAINYACTEILQSVFAGQPKNLRSYHFSIFFSHSKKLGQIQNQAGIIPHKSLNSGALSCLVLNQAVDKLHFLQF